jgi:dihydroorotate dehydrogenase (fumarate)
MEIAMIDLTTNYMGLALRNPLVASSSPLTGDVGTIRELEDAGAAAVVLPSLFEEQMTLRQRDLDPYLSAHAEHVSEAMTYFPPMHEYNHGPDGYCELIVRAKSAVSIPVIASLNGVWMGDWTRYARHIEAAGADALELNVYYVPTDGGLSGGQVEQVYLDLFNDVKCSIHIPVAIKLSPYFSAPAHMACRLDALGADALVLFNRFYQPDFDIDRRIVEPNLDLSTSAELRLRLRWAAILYGKVHANLAITGGVHSSTDVLKAVMAGASVVTLASALLKNGIGHLTAIRTDLTHWMDENDHDSLSQLRGVLSQQTVAEPAAFERANYMRVLNTYALRTLNW